MSQEKYMFDGNQGWQLLFMAIIQQAQEDYATGGRSQNKDKDKSDSLRTAKKLLFGRSKELPGFGELEVLLVRNGFPITFAEGARRVANELKELAKEVKHLGPLQRVDAIHAGPIDIPYREFYKKTKLSASELKDIGKRLRDNPRRNRKRRKK